MGHIRYGIYKVVAYTTWTIQACAYDRVYYLLCTHVDTVGYSYKGMHIPYVYRYILCMCMCEYCIHVLYVYSLICVCVGVCVYTYISMMLYVLCVYLLH